MLFDFHCHPSFKTFLGNRQQIKRKNCWTKLNFDVDANILDSQSSLGQIKAGKANLVVVALYALENAFAGNWKIKLAAGLSDHIEKRFLQEIHKKEWGYHELLLDEHTHLMLSSDISSAKSFIVLDDMSTYHSNSEKLQLILAAEGGHNFYDGVQQAIDPSALLENLRFFKQPENPRLLYVTLTHLQQSSFCTHAFGMKMIKKAVFNPAGTAITELGRMFIQEALSTQNGRRILIDIKHMSWKSREAFYRMRRTDFPEVPVVASHMGVTGVSHLDKPVKKVQTNLSSRCVEVFYHRSLGAVDTHFNPWSINLYDEDIQEIMKSGGLIGLSLDQRILGCGNVSKEIFSADEFVSDEFHLTKPRYHRLPEGHHNTKQKRKNWQIRFFCNNWLHVIKVGMEVVGDNAWYHVCIGSDFDGLIDPLDDFKSASQYMNIFPRLVEWMPVMAQAMGIAVAPNQVQDRVRGLMLNNAVKFLQQHYQ